jgi:hypothetical protein
MSYDSWLTTDTDAENYANAEDAIEERVKELINHNSDFDHTLFENWIADIDSCTVEEADSIQGYLKSKEFEKLGRLLWCISATSREKYAKVQAEKDFEDGNL